MKSPIAILLAATVAFAAHAHAAPDGKRIAVITPPNQNPYIGSWNPAFRSAAEALGMKVSAFTSPYDAALQSQQIDDAIAQKVDALVIDALNHKSVLPALTRAKAAGIPVFMVITPIEKDQEQLFVSFIGPDDENLGRLAAESLVKGLAAENKTTARVAAVTGFSSQLGVQRRMAGFKAVLGEHPAIQLVAEEDGQWNTAQSERLAGEILVRAATQGGLDGFYGMADNQAAGIIGGIDSSGLTAGAGRDAILVVSSNCMKDGMLNIKLGKQYATNSEIPAEEAKAAATWVAAYFDGKPIEKYEYVPSYAVTAANLADYQAACSY